MKRKTMTLVLCLLAALALVSVGFASWVISADANKTVSGNIKVDTVEDKRLSADVALSVQEIVFGTPTATIENPWLTNPDIGEEKLKTTVTIVATENGKAYTGHATDKKIKVSMVEGVKDSEGSITEATQKNYETAVTRGYVSNWVIGNITEPTPGTYTVDITFNWGEHFKDSKGIIKNPYTYYNELKVEDKGDDAKQSLGEMYTLLQNCAFIITVEVVH